jgi:hypothetical protein
VGLGDGRVRVQAIRSEPAGAWSGVVVIVWVFQGLYVINALWNKEAIFDQHGHQHE